MNIVQGILCHPQDLLDIGGELNLLKVCIDKMVNLCRAGCNISLLTKAEEVSYINTVPRCSSRDAKNSSNKFLLVFNKASDNIVEWT